MVKESKKVKTALNEVDDEKVADISSKAETEVATQEPAKEEAPKKAVEEEPEVREEAAPAEKAKSKKKGDEIIEERIYTIPLAKALVRPPKKRAPRAMQLLKAFLIKHMKLDVKVSEDEEEEELPQLLISKEVNEKIWDRGIEKPPRKIRVRAAKDKDGNVTVYLAEKT